MINLVAGLTKPSKPLCALDLFTKLIDQLFQAAAIFDVVSILLFLRRLYRGIMEHDRHVWLDREAFVIAALQQVLDDRPHRAVPLAGEFIIGIVLLAVPDGVFDVHMGNPGFHMRIKLPWILLRPWLWLGPILIKDGIGGIEHPL